jgi:hypothetical protein
MYNGHVDIQETEARRFESGLHVGAEVLVLAVELLGNPATTRREWRYLRLRMRGVSEALESAVGPEASVFIYEIITHHHRARPSTELKDMSSWELISLLRLGHTWRRLWDLLALAAFYTGEPGSEGVAIDCRIRACKTLALLGKLDPQYMVVGPGIEAFAARREAGEKLPYVELEQSLLSTLEILGSSEADGMRHA